MAELSNSSVCLATKVPLELGGQRLDQVAAQLFAEHSRSRLSNWIKDGSLTVDGQVLRPRDKVHAGAQLALNAKLHDAGDWQGQKMALDIVYEDEHILVLNKPAGLVVHPAAGHANGTLLNALLFHAPELIKLPRAGIVHRLDKDTTGLMVVARTLPAQTALVEQLQRHAVARTYECVVIGRVISGSTIDEPIGRSPHNRQRMAVVAGGKPAVTHYRVLERFAAHSHLRVDLETGRTHQIRVHMAHMGFPLVGDPQYAGRFRIPPGVDAQLLELLKNFPRQALHARFLALQHPDSGEPMRWEAPLPEDLQQLLASMQKHQQALP